MNTCNAAAFPGASAKQLRDGERVTIWDLTPPAGAPSPHLHTRDSVVVSFTALKPRVTFVPRGTAHTDDQTAGAERVFAFEVK